MLEKWHFIGRGEIPGSALIDADFSGVCCLIIACSIFNAKPWVVLIVLLFVVFLISLRHVHMRSKRIKSFTLNKSHFIHHLSSR